MYEPQAPRIRKLRRVDRALSETLEDGEVEELRQQLAENPSLAVDVMPPFPGHPGGARPLSFVAMLRYDAPRRKWREVPGAAELAEVLLAAGAPVDGLPGDAETPLMTAASYGDAAVARVLIDAGAALEAVAAPNSRGVPGGTALLHAVVFEMTDVADVLLAAGADRSVLRGLP